MRLNILIGGQAGQGINKVSEIISNVLVNYGYFTFNYRDYPSLIRGGHNFNVLSVSDKRVGSIESKIDGIVAMDEKTIKLHKSELKKGGFIIGYKSFENLGRNLNLAQAGALAKIIGIPKENFLEEIKKEFDNKEALDAAEKGYDSEKTKVQLKQLKNKITLMTGSKGVAEGAINSGMNLYISYPMTPATGLMHELAAKETKEGFMVFQSENETAAINQAIGASFSGAKSFVGTSGGGFDLMTEGLSFQGMAEVPLVVYLASRPGPGTGIPTYSMQPDLNVAIRGGHGEFPRVVIAPGDPTECIEKTNEAFYLADKFNTLSIILSDKDLAEGEFSTDRMPNKNLKVESKRKLPGQTIVKSSSYEHDKNWNTTEDAGIAKKAADERIKRYKEITKECKKFQMTKLYGNPNAKNLIIGWGSTKTAILDAIDSIDGSIETKKGKYKFLQVLYIKPLSEEIKKEIEKTLKAKGKVILIEENLTGQLGRLIREKTGIAIPHRILKYDGRPFFSDKLKEEILKIK
jgi:2-oxoglutarate ferredoxin oxidoreductase subunit alpha